MAKITLRADYRYDRVWMRLAWSTRGGSYMDVDFECFTKSRGGWDNPEVNLDGFDDTNTLDLLQIAKVTNAIMQVLTQDPLNVDGFLKVAQIVVAKPERHVTFFSENGDKITRQKFMKEPR